tara:strand:+ start:385 stop:513 length:129 start_codon:yes stop_codon:yes gene_type:complete
LASRNAASAFSNIVALYALVKLMIIRIKRVWFGERHFSASKA